MFFHFYVNTDDLSISGALPPQSTPVPLSPPQPSVLPQSSGLPTPPTPPSVSLAPPVFGISSLITIPHNMLPIAPLPQGYMYPAPASLEPVQLLVRPILRPVMPPPALPRATLPLNVRPPLTPVNAQPSLMAVATNGHDLPLQQLGEITFFFKLPKITSSNEVMLKS